ncbi:MAG TPA: hypothetical protein VF975_05210 [Thermoanaerobaculia bacterium]
MPAFENIQAVQEPAAGVPVLSPDQMKQKLLAVNRPTAPYRIVDGAADGVDLVAEWKVVDAQWYSIRSAETRGPRAGPGAGGRVERSRCRTR